MATDERGARSAERGTTAPYPAAKDARPASGYPGSLRSPQSPRHAQRAPGTRRARTSKGWPLSWRAPVALLVALLCCLSIVGAVGADELDDQVRAIAKELRCPVCQGETVADSNAQLSVQMRAIIREKLEAGESREQILDYFVARYGESILVTPPARGFTLGVWLAPVVALLVGVAIVGAVLRGWRRGPATPTAAAPTPTTGRLASADEERLERELERFRREGARG